MKFSNDSSIDERIKRQLDVVKDYVVKDAKMPLSNVWLFGSCARGKAQDSSDIDIAVLTDVAVPLFQREGAPLVSMHIYRENIINEPTMPIHKNIIKEGIPLTQV